MRHQPASLRLEGVDLALLHQHEKHDHLALPIGKPLRLPCRGYVSFSVEIEKDAKPR
jgi:hypothetical protein